ncbi:MAG: rhodanese-like domain-containing protein [Candidatus Dormibacter sp.]
MADVMPLVDEGLGNQSYLVPLRDGRALVVDPRRDPAPYLEHAERLGLRIAFAAETHLHADFISGSRELASEGAIILAPAASRLEAPHQALDHGDELDLGGLTLQALGTPGHTPEHLAYLLRDGSRPLALFSGGALIPGGAARTDLISPDQTEHLARALYRSVRQHLAGLPDDLAIYPTHGAGSFCSAGTGGLRTTTVGQERQVNPIFTVPDEDAFVGSFLGGLGSYPPYFLRLREVNRRGTRLYGRSLPEVKKLAVGAFRRHVAAGATLIDARPFMEFGAGHIPGALSIALRPAFASWLGWMVPADRPMIFVLGPDQDRQDLVRQCLNIGYENIVGELEGGTPAWRAAGLPESIVELRHANRDLEGTPLDVRQASEWAGGRVPGAHRRELGSLPGAIDTVPSGPLTIYCGHGERAMTAASLLEAAGRQNLAVLAGGFEAWIQANRPIVTG